MAGRGRHLDAPRLRPDSPVAPAGGPPEGRSWFGELEAIYRELDLGLARLGARCLACGECCTFPPGSPVLYASWPERAYLAGVPRADSTGPRPTGACPWLDTSTMLCTARERRTIGCRAHYCARALPSEETRSAARDLAERALARVKELVRRWGLEWDYAPVLARLSQ